jgi:hypothetical protein
MTFEVQETSRTLGAPIGLLLFTYGDGINDYFAYTDGEVPVTFNGVTYQPIPSDRDSPKASGTLDKAQLTIRLPKDAALAEFFDVFPPSQVVNVTIFGGHVDNGDFKTFWTGRVIALRTSANEAEFTCEPVSTSMRRMGLRRRYGYGCPYVLYGQQCLADKPSASLSVTVAAVSGATVTLPTGWFGIQVPTDFIGGLAEWTSADGRAETRTVIDVVSGSNQVLLSGDAETLVVGGPITMALGCNHQMSGCTLHNNIQNFGGQPWIPEKNPVGVTNNFF